MADTDEDKIVYFDGTITKVDSEGNLVLSDHLMPGEQLHREVTDRTTASEAGTFDNGDKHEAAQRRSQASGSAHTGGRAKTKSETKSEGGKTKSEGGETKSETESDGGK